MDTRRIYPVASYTERKECCVCLESYRKRGYSILNPCLHSVCNTCLTILPDPLCPVCRNLFIVDKGKESLWKGILRTLECLLNHSA